MASNHPANKTPVNPDLDIWPLYHIHRPFVDIDPGIVLPDQDDELGIVMPNE